MKRAIGISPRRRYAGLKAASTNAEPMPEGGSQRFGVARDFEGVGDAEKIEQAGDGQQARANVGAGNGGIRAAGLEEAREKSRKRRSQRRPRGPGFRKCRRCEWKRPGPGVGSPRWPWRRHKEKSRRRGPSGEAANGPVQGRSKRQRQQAKRLAVRRPFLRQGKQEAEWAKLRESRYVRPQQTRILRADEMRDRKATLL